MTDPQTGGASLGYVLDKPYFPGVSWLPPGPSQLSHLFPQTLSGSKAYRPGFILTKHLQRHACSPVPVAVSKSSKKLNLRDWKGPDVRKGHWGSACHEIRHGCWPPHTQARPWKNPATRLVYCQLWSQPSSSDREFPPTYYQDLLPHLAREPWIGAAPHSQMESHTEGTGAAPLPDSSFWAVALFFPHQVESTPRNRIRAEHGYMYL